MSGAGLGRRDVLLLGAQAATLMGVGTTSDAFANDEIQPSAISPSSTSESVTPVRPDRLFNGPYEGANLDHASFPLGGMGSGMFCIDGPASFSKFSLWHHPNLQNAPTIFAAISIPGQKIAKILEGPVPAWKVNADWTRLLQSRNPPGQYNAALGLPRFASASFKASFPFAHVVLKDDKVPLHVQVTAWSPFIPGDADSTSLPTACVEYEFTNISASTLDAVFSFNTMNFMATGTVANGGKVPASKDRIGSMRQGVILCGAGSSDSPWQEGKCAIWVDNSNVHIDHSWFRGMIEPYDSLQMLWNDIQAGVSKESPPLLEDSAQGATLSLPLRLAPGATKTVSVRFAWFVGKSNVYAPYWAEVESGSFKHEPPANMFRPWYAERFANLEDIVHYVTSRSRDLRDRSKKFSGALQASSLPPEVIEAVAANMSILKSPSILRQADGRLWAWEGCSDNEGFGGFGVAPFGEALAHLFPDLARRQREVEFGECLEPSGRMSNRAALPIRPLTTSEMDVYASTPSFYFIIVLCQTWKVIGDNEWLRNLWSKAVLAMDYSIRAVDPNRTGRPNKPTGAIDGALWGVNPILMFEYMGALQAMMVMGRAIGADVHQYADLMPKVRHCLESELFNGSYFIQKVEYGSIKELLDNQKKGLPTAQDNLPDAVALIKRDGPLYQFGEGCLSFATSGLWMAWLAGLEIDFDENMLRRHLASVYAFNFKDDLSDAPITFRYFLGCGREGGLLNCTWPQGKQPTLPEFYSYEVWPGIEYQVAGQLIATGKIEDGLKVIRACRGRYDGRARNPFSETEAGTFYQRSASSYALLQAFSGARYDSVEKILYLKPAIRGDFQSLLSTATGYGMVGVRGGKPFVDVVSGTIPYQEIRYVSAA